MTPSDRLYALHSLNLRERQSAARLNADLLGYVVIGLALAAAFIWAIIGAHVS